MSFLNTAYATPSRVRGVYRYLLQSKGQKENRESLLAAIAPTVLSETQAMAKGALGEGIKLGLFREEGDVVMIAPDLPREARDPISGDALLPTTIARLIFANDENRDFARVAAWYLGQEPFDAPGDWDAAQAAMVDETGTNRFNLNDARYGQFEDWFCYLGFGAHYAGRLMPEPSAYLRSHLPALFAAAPGKNRLLVDFLADLAKLSPVFEGGELRREADLSAPEGESRELSRATALALWRLQDLKIVELSYSSDGAYVLLPTEGAAERMSHITLLKD